MKTKDVVIGMKVVPFKKSVGVTLDHSSVWEDAKRNGQHYLFVCARSTTGYWELSDREYDYAFDYFKSGDFNPYVLSKEDYVEELHEEEREELEQNVEHA